MRVYKRVDLTNVKREVILMACCQRRAAMQGMNCRKSEAGLTKYGQDRKTVVVFDNKRIEE